MGWVVRLPFWLALALPLLLVIGAIALIVAGDWRTGVDLALLLLAILPPIVKNTPMLYLMFSRVKYWIGNPTIDLEIACELEAKYTSNDRDMFVEGLLSVNRKENRLITRDDSTQLIRFSNIMIEIQDSSPLVAVLSEESLRPDFHPTIGSLAVSTSNMRVSYRALLSDIDNILIPLFERAFTTFKPDETKYSLKMSFGKSNPFFGLYLQQLRQEYVKEFSATYIIPTGETAGTFTIGLRQISVTSESLQGFRQSVVRAITFKTV